jgi:hypothetical protein
MWNKLNLGRFNRHLTIFSISSLVGYWIYKNTTLETKINTLMNYEKKEIPSLTIDRKVGFINDKYILTVFSDETFYESVLQYIHKKYPDKIRDFSYEEETIYTFNEWRYRRKEKPATIKVLTPRECNFDINYEYEKIDYKINIDVSVQRDHNNDLMTLTKTHECCTDENILSKLTITCDNRDSIISLVDVAKKDIKKDYDKHKKCSSETMRIYYYKKDYWALLSKAPKRPVDTIYLKEGQREKIVEQVETFFSDKTRNIYLSFGIPYKSVSMIYGPPGTGKTSIIRGLASVLDCDLYVLPITKEMKDTDFVGAFSYISDNEDKERIIVIEDIDTIFEERKEGDATHNGITLQSFLNCLDGFTCVEGTMLFLTANKPEVLDYAMVRSCRIDNKIELGYADKYQTKQMFTKFLPDQKDKFKEFYDLIRHKEFTTASLQEFLFYNRDCENILELMDQFTDILEKNDPKNFEVVKNENKNFYS